jgi:hypothetical protein
VIEIAVGHSVVLLPFLKNASVSPGRGSACHLEPFLESRNIVGNTRRKSAMLILLAGEAKAFFVVFTNCKAMPMSV